MSQDLYECLCNYVISPHMMFHLSRLYSRRAQGLSGVLYWNISIVLAKSRFAASCVCHLPQLPVHVCMHVCMYASLCVCAPIIRYFIIKEATIRIAKITIFSVLVVINANIKTSQVQGMSGSHSKVQHTRTTVS